MGNSCKGQAKIKKQQNAEQQCQNNEGQQNEEEYSNNNYQNQEQYCYNNQRYKDIIDTSCSYNDDDFIQFTENQTSELNDYNLNEMLEFTLAMQYSKGKLFKSVNQYLPGMVSIQAKEHDIQIKGVGVDLICLIDKSGSMCGEKIEMVRKTLLNLLDFLTDKDRLCLIQFDDRPLRLTPLKIVSKNNLSYFEKIINQIFANGQDIIGNATATALEQIKKRKYTNNVTSIFLLSDGQDSTAAISVPEQFKRNNDVFSMHTFGYGSDHDPKLMTQLCNLRNGSFYFVNDVKLLDQYFVDAFGGLKSVVAEQIDVKIKCQPKNPFQNINISKTYGNMWNEQNKGKDYQISLTHLGIGRRKDFVFELLLPQFDQKILDEQRHCHVLEAEVTLKSTQTQQIIKKQAQFSLTFYNEDEEILQNEENIDIATQYFRVKGADVIDDARKACEQNKYEDGKLLIIQAIENIKKNEKVAMASQDIIDDLEQGLQAIKPKNFENYGRKQMCQLVSNNYCQEGINAMFDDNGVQDQKKQKTKFSNKRQIEWVQKVQQNNK